MTDKKSSKFAPDGTLTFFEYFGTNSHFTHPITGQSFPVTPSDTLLFEQTPGFGYATSNPIIKYGSEDLTIHRIESKCPNCSRPVRVHRIIDDSSILTCRCEYIESTQSIHAK